MVRKTPFADLNERSSAGRFGWILFIASLAVLFISMWIGFAIMRFETASTWPVDLPHVPAALWLSTVVLLVSSGTAQHALKAIRRDKATTAGLALLATFALGLMFLAIQTFCWFWWHAEIASRWDGSTAERFALAAFYILTAMHALHVIGGLGPMVWVMRKLGRGAYTADQHTGVTAITWYWHFLDVVWIVLMLTLWFGV
ncbi:MAG: heme-copper oxidase subunit III [Phycisphaerales bacterium]|nr:heme-copper oxidase subunit III [Phycisphaerales bacterium]